MRTEVEAPAPGPGPEDSPPDVVKGRRVTIIVLLVGAVMTLLWVGGPYFFAGRDDPTAIDNKPVREAVESGCPALRDDLAAVPADLAPADRAEAQNRAVDAFVARVRAVGPEEIADDTPVDQWLADWELIVATRRQAVREGRPYATPVVDVPFRAPVNVRMFALIRSGLEQCDVPDVLLTEEPGRA